MIQRFRNSRIGFAFFGVMILICFFPLNSFSKFQQVQKGNYKTLNDSVFAVDDLIRTPAILFDLGRCELKTDSSFDAVDSLKPVTLFLKKFPNLVVEFGCHTDYVDPSSSQRLTYCRARSCYEALLKLGVDSARLSFNGYGASAPFVLQNDIILPSGKVAPKGMILNGEMLDRKFPPRWKNPDNAFLRSLDRRTELKILKTDFKQ